MPEKNLVFSLKKHITIFRHLEVETCGQRKF